MQAIRRPIFLVGLPACGKSAIGQALARRLSWTFIELNEEIEKRHGPILEILARDDGQETLRHIERQELFLLREPAVGRNSLQMVVATSSGCFQDLQCRQLIHRHGTSVLLDISPKELQHRLRADAAQGYVRKLSQEPSGVIEAYVADSIGTYQHAQVKVAVADLGIEPIVNLILFRAERMRQMAA